MESKDFSILGVPWKKYAKTKCISIMLPCKRREQTTLAKTLLKCRNKAKKSQRYKNMKKPTIFTQRFSLSSPWKRKKRQANRHRNNRFLQTITLFFHSHLKSIGIGIPGFWGLADNKRRCFGSRDERKQIPAKQKHHIMDKWTTHFFFIFIKLKTFLLGEGNKGQKL